MQADKSSLCYPLTRERIAERRAELARQRVRVARLVDALYGTDSYLRALGDLQSIDRDLVHLNRADRNLQKLEALKREA